MTSANVTVTFECELSKDGLKVEWFKGDKKLKRDDTYNMSSVGKVHTLVIDKVEADSVGEYSAVFQKISTSAKLSMEGDYLSNWSLTLYVALFYYFVTSSLF